jgi:hypothetical protein
MIKEVPGAPREGAREVIRDYPQFVHTRAPAKEKDSHPFPGNGGLAKVPATSRRLTDFGAEEVDRCCAVAES